MQSSPGVSLRDLLQEELRAFACGQLREELRQQLLEFEGKLAQVREGPLPQEQPQTVRDRSLSFQRRDQNRSISFERLTSPLQPFERTTSGGSEVHEWRRHPRQRQSQKFTKEVPRQPAPAQKEKLIRESKKYSALSSSLLPRQPSSNVSKILGLVESQNFAYFISVMIVLNAITIGLQTEHMATTLSVKIPEVFYVTELLFTVVFSLELGLRIAAHGYSFFHGHEALWNLFDAALILLQLAEQFMSLAVLLWSRSSDDLQLSELTDDTSILRILRIFRLMRILRLLRVVHLNGELQAIVAAVLKGMRSFCWTVVLLVLLMYVVGVFLTQSVTDHQVSVLARDSQGRTQDPLQEYFGSLFSTMLALFEAISDGKEWRDMLQPLMEQISPWLALPFCMYISFVAFALMNILTGIFVDKALQSGQEEKRRFLLQEVRSVFTDARHEEISLPDFQAQLQNPHMQQLFTALDIDDQDAEELFHVLDAQHSGSIETEEFVNGCLRLDGPAKAVDLAAFIEEHRRLSRNFLEQNQFVSSSLAWLMQAVQGSMLSPQGASRQEPAMQRQHSAF